MNAEKQQAIKKVEELCKEYPIVGVVNMQNLPMAQLQRMRKKMRQDMMMFMTKKRLMKLALEEVKKSKVGIEGLEEKLNGIPALMFTKENPFRLFALIKKNKSRAAAKAGQLAPNDIKISAGPTPFPPGPIISELGAMGLKTSVKNGKVEVMADKVILKEGDLITDAAASLLAKLGIEPMEVGLDLVAVYEDGQIYGKDILSVDEDEYAQNFTQAHQWAFNLAVEAGIYTNETTELLIMKAFQGAKSVALEANILNESTKDLILAKAEAQARALEQELNLPATTSKTGVEESAQPNQEAETQETEE